MNPKARIRVWKLLKAELNSANINDFRRTYLYGRNAQGLPTCPPKKKCRLCTAARIVRREDKRPKVRAKKEAA